MTSRLSVFFSEGFRVFFFAAGVFAVFAGLVWLLWLGVHYRGGMVTVMPFNVPPHQWHAHEMIFGFASAALGGFLLTAVPNWTGTPAARRLFVTASGGVWLAGRFALWFSGSLPVGVVAVIDLAFLPILVTKIALQLVKRPKPQNVLFVVFLSIVWLGNLCVHLEWMELADDTLDTGMRVGLIGLAAMIGVLGGRVTPAFTRNAMNRAEVPERLWPKSNNVLEGMAMGLSILLPLALLVSLPERVVGALAILAGMVQLARLTGWRGRWTVDKPILLALHLGMAMLGIGLLLWGLALEGIGSEVAALHILGIGAVGGMTLAVMSRAIMGHTGRELIAPEPVAAGYLLIAVSAAVRWVGSELSGDWYFPMVLASGGLWVLAFVLYVIAVWPIVTAPRAVRSGG
ncbi:NnrS family protein [Tropicimonas marinistellae]|uniref:NnrS family protein n=1 Tax=Tropicimonas marinistellae TaxID=1739787 RepID=UPI0008335F24|nr:NnrS family protein [Tropicimonas marinistellae]